MQEAGATVTHRAPDPPEEAHGYKEPTAPSFRAPAASPKEPSAPTSKDRAAPSSQPALELDKVASARSVALAAARAAAAHATPAQRDRAVAEAATLAYAAHLQPAPEQAAQLPPDEAGAAAGPGGAGASAPGPARDKALYSEPDWAGAPTGVPYTLEVMKGGQIVQQSSVAGKSCYRFGRGPGCDYMLEHPSASRLHAVLQFRASDGAAFMYDNDSAHGTFLNKRRLKPRVYAPLCVGDQLRFGLSTRAYLFGGPPELLPEEGLSQAQRAQLRALEAVEARRDRDAHVAKAQMDMARAAGISWGMGEDASEGDEDSSGLGGAALGAAGVDWRAYAASHGLSDKQQKLAAKIEKRRNRIANLQREMDRIRAKQSAMEEMSVGQAATLARNEAAIDAAAAELEDLEEALDESVAAAIRGRAKPAAEPSARGSRATVDEDGEMGSGGEEDDEFYDRTGEPRKKKRRVQAAPAAEDAASLYGRKEALLEKRQRLAAALAEEETASAAVDENAALTAGESAADGDKMADGDKTAMGGAAADPLDAYMTDVASQIEHDKVAALQREIAKVDAEMKRAEALLRVADPEGYFCAGSAAAEAAKARSLRAAAVERQRRAAAETQRATRLAEKAAERASVASFQPEEEEPDPDAPVVIKLTPPVADTPAPTLGRGHTDAAAPSEPREDVPVVGPKAAAVPAQLLEPASDPAANPHRLGADIGSGRGGLEIRRPAALPTAPADAEAQPNGAIGASTAREDKSGVAVAAAAEAEAVLAANLALLQRAREAPLADDDAAQGELGGDAFGVIEGSGAAKPTPPRWAPPQGQSGDGRTRLNDLLGY